MQTKILLLLGALWCSMQAQPSIVRIINDTDLYLSVKRSKKTQDCRLIESLKSDIVRALNKAGVSVSSHSNLFNIPLEIEPRTSIECCCTIPHASKSLSKKALKVRCSKKVDSCKYPFLGFREGLNVIALDNHDGKTNRELGEYKTGLFDENKMYQLTIKQADTGFVHQFITNGIQMNLIRSRCYVVPAYHRLYPKSSFVVILETLDAREHKHVHA